MHSFCQLKLSYFLVPTFLHTFFPLTTLPLSQSACVHKLKVDFICPIVSALNSHLPRLCRSVLCGSDNGSNYICSMSVLQHSSSSTGRLRHHDAQCRVSCSHSLENQSWRAWILSHRNIDTNSICLYFCTQRTPNMQTGKRKPMDIFFVLQFSLLIHSAGISQSLNMLCSFSGIYWNLVLWHCLDKLPVGEHTAALLTLQYKAI